MKRTCLRCGLEKRISQDSLISEFYSKAKWPDGSIRRWQSECKDCQRESQRVRIGIKRTGKPYNPRKKTPQTREQRNEARRLQYKRDMQDPEKAKKIREDRRLQATLRRRRNGVPERGVTYKLKDGPLEERLQLVSVIPFIRWWESLNGTRPSHEQMGPKLSRAVYRAIEGSPDQAPTETRRMRLDIVDEVGVIVGVNHAIHMLYPDI